MMTDAAISKLASLPGSTLVKLEEGGPHGVDGVHPRWGLYPESGLALAEAVEALREYGLAAIVRGGGNRMTPGNPPVRGDVLLSMQRLAGVEELDPDEGVCRALGGTALAEIRKAANASGWELPLDAPGPGSTLGGVVAAAAEGPRALGFGRPRDLVLGLDVVLGTGERTRCGGRVVKNVTGYDLAKLYTGSFGTLGVIEAAWLRLSPLPEHVAMFRVEPDSLADACTHGLTASRRASARAAIVTSSTSSRAHLVVELAGQEETVQHDGEWLARELGARPTEVAVLDELRSLQLVSRDATELRFRISTLFSQLAVNATALQEAGASVLASPGTGSLDARFPVGATREEDRERSAAAFRVVCGLMKSAGGGFAVLAAPRWVKEERDAFNAPAAQLRLFRALKERFDPAAVLNPGRMAGRV